PLSRPAPRFHPPSSPTRRSSDLGSRLRGARLRLSAAFWRRPWVKASGLLSPPLLAFLLVYVGSLGVLFVSAFWTVDSFTGKLVQDRKSTRLNSSHQIISYAVFCL